LRFFLVCFIDLWMCLIARWTFRTQTRVYSLINNNLNFSFLGWIQMSNLSWNTKDEESNSKSTTKYKPCISIDSTWKGKFLWKGKVHRRNWMGKLLWKGKLIQTLMFFIFLFFYVQTLMNWMNRLNFLTFKHKAYTNTDEVFFWRSNTDELNEWIEICYSVVYIAIGGFDLGRIDDDDVCVPFFFLLGFVCPTF